jgi:hypothetical protein
MPEIYRLHGIKIMMRLKEDHHTPHIHAKYAEEWASIRVSDGAVLAGSLNRPAMAMVRKWLADNREAVLRAWDRAKDGVNPGRIGGRGGSGRRHKAKRSTKTRSKSKSRERARLRLRARRRRRRRP